MDAQNSSPCRQSAQMAANVAATTPVEPLTYTVADAAVILGINRATVYRLLYRRILTPLPGLRHKRIPRRQIEAYLRGGGHV